jgi:LemA protein
VAEIFLWISLGTIVLIFLYVIMVFNALVRGRNQVTEAWSGIEIHLKRRYDLIPNLVETVKGYAKHESTTLERVISARNIAMRQSGGPENHSATENALSQSLKSIFALSESYSDLKTNQSFTELQRDITDTEDKIQTSRRFYSMALTFNNRTETFPSIMIARVFNYKKLAFFELDEGEKAAVYKPV